MTDPNKLFGRLGNRMFQMAAMMSYAKKIGSDFYFQDESNFKDIEDDVKKIFGEGIGFLEQVGIHVRRGDYVNNTFHTDLTEIDYYERAIALFPNDNFLIFSDDTEWCKKRFTDKRFQVMEGGDELEDFNMLASCKSIIMANSSFSWWSSYLNPNHGKTIICPKEEIWFKDSIIRTKVPKTWIQI